MNSTRVLSFDPGETTGVIYAGCEPAKQLNAWRGLDILFVNQIPLSKAFNVYDLVQRVKPHVIVYERFALYQHKAQAQVNSEFPTVEVIGYIKLAHHHLVRSGYPCELVKQPASVMERVSVLDEHQVVLKGYRHATAAYKHLRYFLTMRRQPLPSD